MGRDWNSPEELQREQEAFLKLVHALAGVYYWGFVTTLNFEWAFLTRKKEFRWPMTFYFLGRYCQVLCIIGLLIVVNNTSGSIHCQTLFTFAQLTGQAAIGFASLQSLRALFCLWALLMQGVKIEINSTPQGCAIVNSHSATLPATFAYTMSLDLCVLLVTMYQLVIMQGRRSHLMNLLFTDGLIYFGFAFIVNLPATVFMILNLNPFMSVLFGFPTTVVSTVIACRAVRRLSDFNTSGPQVSAGFPITEDAFSEASARVDHTMSWNMAAKQSTNVHVHMETLQTVGGDSESERKKGYGAPEGGVVSYIAH
ncbi:unnamed protein product [Somion occarium]|uniref:Transmembrane protein n=1 Tax=Somion occarium TaxID=3059160 RepID=A0ABP1CXI7_9APHY